MSVHFESHLTERFDEGDRKAALAVEKSAHDIEGGAKARSRVDTGQMRDGWQAHMLGPHTWTVVNPVDHTVFNEYGTEGEDGEEGMSAQPMLHPAVEHERASFELAIRQAYSG